MSDSGSSTSRRASTDDRWIHRPDMWSGLVLGGALATRTFQPSLMPRATAHQALVSGASGAIGFGVGNAVYGLTTRTGSIAGDLALVGATTAGGFALSRLPERPAEGNVVPLVRTVGSALAAGGAAASVGIAVRGIRPPKRDIVAGAVTAIAVAAGIRSVVRGLKAQAAAHDDYDPSPPKPLPALGQSLGVAAGLSVAFTGIRNTSRVIGRALEVRVGVPPQASRWIGRGLTLPVWFGAGKFVADSFVNLLRVYDRVVDAGFDRAPSNPLRSAGEGSPIPFARLGREGRRFVLNVADGEQIDAVMGETDGRSARDPIRVFVGYAAARTDDDRIDLAMDELRRTGAFDRQLLVVGCAAGNGYVNTLPLEVVDYVLGGDTAAVAVQYGRLPSFLTLRRVTRGGGIQRRLLEKIQAELADRPTDRRPMVVVYGESLGAWAGQDCFIHQGVSGLDDLDVARALWVGTPYYSKWRREVLVDQSVEVPTGSVLEIGDPEPLRALTDDERASVRAVVLTHGNDPVAYICAGLIVQRPDWLRGPRRERPWGVPAEMGWLPAITTIQVIVDAVNATRPVPGVFRATGHEYSGDLPDVVLDAYGIAHPAAEVWGRLVDHLMSVDAERASHARRRSAEP
jgi:uncharacterized membrane protein